MKSFLLILFCSFSWAMCSQAQDEKTTTKDMDSEIPYHQIPDAPDSYLPGNVAARMVDGLGYRYYWATEGLREKDLAYKPSEDSRAVSETLDHLYGLSKTIANAAKKEPNVRGAAKEELTFEEKRKKTLENFKTASDLLRGTDAEGMKDLKIIFKRGEQSSEFPFWNLLNGPIADAIYHTGQIVAHRRASGNPLNPKVSVFRGKNRE